MVKEQLSKQTSLRKIWLPYSSQDWKDLSHFDCQLGSQPQARDVQSWLSTHLNKLKEVNKCDKLLFRWEYRQQRHQDQTYVQRQSTLCGSEAGMQPFATKYTTSNIIQITWVVVKEILAHKQAAPAIDITKILTVILYYI